MLHLSLISLSMGILFVSFVLWVHRLYKNNRATIFTFNSEDTDSSDVLCDVLKTRLPNCSPCDNIAVRISAVPRSQVMAALSYFAFSSIADTFNLIDGRPVHQQLSGELTLAVSPEYIWAITSQCMCKGYINENESKLEKVIDYYSSISSSFILKNSDALREGIMLQNNIVSAKNMLNSVDYPKGKWIDALMLFLLLLCGGIVPSLFMLTVCSMLRRAYTTRRNIYKMLGPDLSTCPTVEPSAVFNSSCPICWNEWGGGADVTPLKQRQPPEEATRCVVALQCSHALCRECLTTMELTKLGDHLLSSGGGGGGADRDSPVLTTSAAVAVVVATVTAAESCSDSIRCPCCTRRTPYSRVRRVTL